MLPTQQQVAARVKKKSMSYGKGVLLSLKRLITNNMKNYSFCITLFCWLFVACSQPQIEITFKEFTNDTVIICHCPLKNYSTLRGDKDLSIIYDTLLMQNGIINLIPDKQPSLYVISLNERPAHPIRMAIYPNDRIHIDILRTEYNLQCRATGSEMAEGITDYMQTLRPINERIDSLCLLLEASPSDTRLLRPYNQLFDQRRLESARWIREHSSSPAAGIILRYAPLDSIPALCDVLDMKILHSELSPLIEKLKDNACRYISTMQDREKIKQGAKAPDFTLCDPQGKDWKLSQLQGKWVVLDFWGTWCGYCLQGIPEMKKYESKYREQCTFVSIDCQDTRETWIAALEEYRMPWLQLYNPSTCNADKDLSMVYGILGFPTKLIITPGGYIHEIFVGEDLAFYDALDQLFK